MFRLGNRQEKASTPILERLEALERDHKRIRLEWEETADKVYRWMKRTQKRDRDDAATEPANGDSPAPLHPAVARILSRRRRGRGLPESVSG